MKRKILSNIKADLIFFSRNGWLIGIVAVLVLHALLSFIFGGLIPLYHANRFENIQNIVGSINNYGFIIVVALGIVTIFSHSTQRCLKMVFTKPCLPDVWIFSLFLSIAIVAILIFFLSFLTGSLLFVIWKVPYQPGLIFVCIKECCEAMIMSFFLLLLSLIVHPLIAVFLITVLNESSLYYICLSVRAALESTSTFSFWHAFWLNISKSVSEILYRTVPIINPYAEKFNEVVKSWLVLSEDWAHLTVYVLYTMVASWLMAIFSTEALKKKRLI
ncbi:MAG TPA: hypothetical protein PK303_06250 [bacterium]|nr:hypothetical protein [bacterium]HOL35215.1 hypothetical protein [bacterium]HPP08701.1 hypothetical protein [bacterium]